MYFSSIRIMDRKQKRLRLQTKETWKMSLFLFFLIMTPFAGRSLAECRWKWPFTIAKAALPCVKVDSPSSRIWISATGQGIGYWTSAAGGSRFFLKVFNSLVLLNNSGVLTLDKGNQYVSWESMLSSIWDTHLPVRGCTEAGKPWRSGRNGGSQH